MAIPEMLRAVWERSLPVIGERLAERELASSNAHKLAGSLGMFGFMGGSEVARLIETMLEAEGPVDGVRLGEYARLLRAELGWDTPPYKCCLKIRFDGR
jgi:HPt (histidine-containing phosphotransfer) domain-containing protein